jgi:hypothetical protein
MPEIMDPAWLCSTSTTMAISMFTCCKACLNPATQPSGDRVSAIASQRTGTVRQAELTDVTEDAGAGKVMYAMV